MTVNYLNTPITSQIGFTVQTVNSIGYPTFLARSLTSSDGSIIITNGNGSQGNPSITVNPTIIAGAIPNAMAITSLKI